MSIYTYIFNDPNKPWYLVVIKDAPCGATMRFGSFPTREEAEQVREQLLKRIEAGETFAQLTASREHVNPPKPIEYAGHSFQRQVWLSILCVSRQAVYATAQKRGISMDEDLLRRLREARQLDHKIEEYLANENT